MRTATRFAAVALTAGLLAAPALAQDTGDAPPQRERARQARPGAPTDMSPERLQAVWTWEARTVATALKLDDAASKAIVADWTAVREDLQKQMREMAEARRAERGQDTDRAQRGQRGQRGAGAGAGAGEGRGQGDQARARRGAPGDAGPAAEVREKAMATLKTKLSATLSGATLDGAMKAFDVPTAGWDRATDAIVQLKLEPTNQMSALLGAHGYLAGQASLREDASGGGDRAAMREKMQSLRSTFQLSLTEAGLSSEQMRTVMAAMNPGRGGRGGAGGAAAPGRGGRGGAGGDTGEGRGGRGGRGGAGGGGN